MCRHVSAVVRVCEHAYVCVFRTPGFFSVIVTGPRHNIDRGSVPHSGFAHNK